MKRLWIAVLLLSIVSGLCTFSVMYQDTQIDALLADLDHLEEVYDTGDMAESRRLAENLQEEYQRRTAIFPFFISHDDLADCQSTVAAIPASLKADNPEEFLLETARMRAQLHWLLMVDRPILQNIL